MLLIYMTNTNLFETSVNDTFNNSMYDRLGELLNEALDTERETLQEILQEPLEEEQEQKQSIIETVETVNAESTKENIANEKEFYVPYHIKSDFALLGITGFRTTETEVKNAYKEKLKIFHPDRQKDIPVLKKIAHEKTAQIVDAYKRIQDWISSREEL